MSFYAVRRGRQTGVFESWDQCSAAVTGFSGAQFKKFSTAAEAWTFVKAGSSKDNSSGAAAGVRQVSPSAPPASATAAAAPLASAAARAGATAVRPLKRHLPSQYLSSSRSYVDDAKRKCQPFLSGSSSQPNDGTADMPGETEELTDGKRAQLNASNDLSTDSEGNTIVYTDGACHGNGKKQPAAGIGVFWGPGHASNVSERLEGRQTNNHAEIKAACKAIQQAKQMGVRKLCIRTDSRFLIDCVTKWMHSWKKNGWTTASGGAVKNRDELQFLDELLQQGIKVKWEHVDAHVGIIGNEAADSLANDGARKPLPGEDK